jgi:tetratricopeptide (TPR) repeat protein
MDRNRNSSFRAPLIACALLLAFSLSLEDAEAAKRRRSSGGGGGGGGGVMLQTPEPHTAVEHNNRGVELGSKGLWPDAIREAETALQMDPWNPEFKQNLSGAHLRYANDLLKRGKSYDAAIQFRKAMYVDPSNSPADEGLDECIRRNRKNPDDYSYRKNLAESADETQDYKTAVVEWRKCTKMRDDGPTHAGLGNCLLKVGYDKETVEGFAELRIAVGKTWDYKNNDELRRQLSACHAKLGDILKEFAYKARERGSGTIGLKRLLNAGIEYRRAVQVNPANTDAARGLIEVSREAVAINPSFDNHLALGGAYLLINDFEHAKQEYEDCWKADARRTELPTAQKAYHLAVALYAKDSPEMLANTLEKVTKATQKDPKDAMWWYVLGRARETMYEKSGSDTDKEAAITAYQNAASINRYIAKDLEPGLRRLTGQAPEVASGQTPANPKTPKPGVGAAAATPAQPEKVDDTAKRALAFAPIEKKLNSGDVTGAQTDLNGLLEKNPKDGRAWLLLGHSYEKMQTPDLDQAIVAFRQAALLKEPGADEALDTISSSRIAPMLAESEKQIQSNNLVQAAASLREAISIAPHKSMLYEKLADVLQKMGDKEEAAKLLKKADKIKRSETEKK